MLFDVSVVEVPQSIDNVEYRKIMPAGSRLAHSSLYSSPEAIALIAKFVSNAPLDDYLDIGTKGFSQN